MLGFSQGLTDEDFHLMGWLNNPRFNYKKQFQRLKKIHNFTFDTRHSLTPQRKAAIRKAYNRYLPVLSKIESGKYTFIKAKKSQIKNLSAQFPHSNKGVIYNHPVELGATRKTKIFGRGKQTKLVDQIKLKYPIKELKGLTKYSFYLPWPEDIGPMFHDLFIEHVTELLKPDYISVAVNGYAGLASHQHDDAIESGERIKSLIGKQGQEVYTGIFILYWRKRLNNKWLQSIEQKIESLY